MAGGIKGAESNGRSRSRGKPPDAVVRHFELVWRVRELEERGHSVRNACRIVQQKYYADRTEGSIRQTYVELTTPKAFARPGAVRNSYGYISADQWKLTSQARKRLIDLCRRIEFLFAKTAHEAGENHQPLGLMGLTRKFPARTKRGSN
ncbi:MAG: hypothetical protein EXR12_05415 [Rhodospirillaceae bacterium]|nr:hypothetical protein [Rhodospirillaceae bacterium]